MHLVSSAACLLLTAAAFAGDLGSRAVGVFMEFDSAPVTASIEVMEREVTALLKSSGITLDWRLARQNRGKESFAGLVLLKFKGSCRADLFHQPASDFGSLGEDHPVGFTKVAHGRVLPYTEVECDQVRDALSYLPPGAGRQARQHALGIALGRVVAHELYHILARTTGHAGEGLAKASHSLQDLVSPKELGFRPDDSRAIAGGVASEKN